MRKVTIEAVEAFNAWREFKSSNTTVTKKINGSMTIELFGNQIAKREKKNLIINNRGYVTMTTAERLRGVVSWELKIVQWDMEYTPSFGEILKTRYNKNLVEVKKNKKNAYILPDNKDIYILNK